MIESHSQASVSGAEKEMVKQVNDLTGNESVSNLRDGSTDGVGTYLHAVGGGKDSHRADYFVEKTNDVLSEDAVMIRSKVMLYVLPVWFFMCFDVKVIAGHILGAVSCTDITTALEAWSTI